MPLQKRVQTAVTDQPKANTESSKPQDGSGPLTPNGVRALLDKQDTTSRKILLQGAYQNALQSMGVVQHGGNTFEDYLARVEQAANASVEYVLRNL
jgi:hypothetical protein